MDMMGSLFLAEFEKEREFYRIPDAAGFVARCRLEENTDV